MNLADPASLPGSLPLHPLLGKCTVKETGNGLPMSFVQCEKCLGARRDVGGFPLATLSITAAENFSAEECKTFSLRISSENVLQQYSHISN